MNKQELLERANALRLEVRAKCAEVERLMGDIIVLVASYCDEIDRLDAE